MRAQSRKSCSVHWPVGFTQLAMKGAHNGLLVPYELAGFKRIQAKVSPSPPPRPFHPHAPVGLPLFMWLTHNRTVDSPMAVVSSARAPCSVLVVMLWCCGVVLSWCISVVVVRCRSVVALWCCGIVVLWCCGVVWSRCCGVVMWLCGVRFCRCCGGIAATGMAPGQDERDPSRGGADPG